VGEDPYGCYQLSYWAQTTEPKDFAPGGQDALKAAAEETYRHVPITYKQDLELNRGRHPTPKGAIVLDIFSRETLQLPHEVTFDAGRYAVDVNGARHTYQRPDDLAAFLIEDALKRGGHNIDSVRWDPADGGRYVISKRSVEQRVVYHSELLRQFGYRV
jgi:hypothetical protein